MRACRNCGNYFQKISNERKCMSCTNRRCVDCQASLAGLRVDAERCKDCKRVYVIGKAQRWYKENFEKKRNYDAMRRETKRELFREASRRNRLARPAEKRADTNSRRRRFKDATPQWANKFFIREAYALAELRSAVTGFRWHVDHVIPIRNELVCGLHVENNLRVIPAVDNLRKSNHFSIRHAGRA